MSSVRTSLRFLLARSWNGRSFFFSRSYATASVSITNDLTLGLMHYRFPAAKESVREGGDRKISGTVTHLWYRFYQIGILGAHIFRISTKHHDLASVDQVNLGKQQLDSSISLWKGAGSDVLAVLTCALSPSYLYSHVNSLPSKRSNTSPIAFVGFANMGFNGVPEGITRYQVTVHYLI